MSELSAHRSNTGRRRPTRRQRRGLEIAVLVIAVVLAGWGADTLARQGAEALLARSIQRATGVADLPTVNARGFAFLPQVVRGAYGTVDVTTRGIVSGPLRIDEVRSELRDVRVPFHDVLVQDVRQVGIGESDQHVRLRYEDLNAYFTATGRSITLSPADDGTVRLDGQVDVLGQPVRVGGTVTLSVSQANLRVSPGDIDTGSTALDRVGKLLLQQRLSLTVPLDTLPFGHELTAVSTDADGVHLDARAQGIVMRP